MGNYHTNEQTIEHEISKLDGFMFELIKYLNKQ